MTDKPFETIEHGLYKLNGTLMNILNEQKKMSEEHTNAVEVLAELTIQIGDVNETLERLLHHFDPTL